MSEPLVVRCEATHICQDSKCDHYHAHDKEAMDTPCYGACNKAGSFTGKCVPTGENK